MTQLLTPKQTAAMLNVSLSTLYRLKDRGLLPFHCIGGGVRFAISDLERFLESCRKDLRGKYNGNPKNKGQMVC